MVTEKGKVTTMKEWTIPDHEGGVVSHLGDWAMVRVRYAVLMASRPTRASCESSSREISMLWATRLIQLALAGMSIRRRPVLVMEVMMALECSSMEALLVAGVVRSTRFSLTDGRAWQKWRKFLAIASLAALRIVSRRV